MRPLALLSLVRRPWRGYQYPYVPAHARGSRSGSAMQRGSPGQGLVRRPLEESIQVKSAFVCLPPIEPTSPLPPFPPSSSRHISTSRLEQPSAVTASIATPSTDDLSLPWLPLHVSPVPSLESPHEPLHWFYRRSTPPFYPCRRLEVREAAGVDLTSSSLS